MLNFSVQQSGSVTHTNIYSFLHLFLIWFIPGDWIEIPVLYTVGLCCSYILNRPVSLPVKNSGQLLLMFLPILKSHTSKRVCFKKILNNFKMHINMRKITLKDKEINPNLLWEIIHKPYTPEHKTPQSFEKSTFKQSLKIWSKNSKH